MNSLKMNPVGHAVSSPDGASDFLVDRVAKHSGAADGYSTRRARKIREIDGGFPGLQALAKLQSLRVAIKVGGRRI
jgi:hypothetical protein